MKKTTYNPQKRTNFLKLFGTSGLCALLATGIFAYGYRQYLYTDIREQLEDEADFHTKSLFTVIDHAENGDADPFPEIQDAFSLWTGYAVIADWTASDYNKVQICPEMTDGCYAVSALVNAENEVVVSNRRILSARLNFDEELDNGNGFEVFICDNEKLKMPEVDALYQTLENAYMKSGDACWFELRLSSVYVNRDDRTFIPHTGTIVYPSKEDPYGPLTEMGETEEFSVTIDNSNYELFEVNGTEKKPKILLTGYRGANVNLVNAVAAEYSFNDNTSGGFDGAGRTVKEVAELMGKTTDSDHDVLVVYDTQKLTIQGEQYHLFLEYGIDADAPIIVRRWLQKVLICLAVTLILALLWSWWKNTKNKARYAFEDYQKTLINNLAHDIKTPLTAISGYTENALRTLKKGEVGESVSYLEAIMENVDYTDKIASRTLELNRMSEIRSLKKEPIALHELTEKALQKYSILLEEKQITVRTNGEAEIQADKDTLTAAVENLIANAVQYTTDHGTISLEFSDKGMTIENTVAEQVDTKDLTMPFVRGDSSRTGKNGTGLGLALVQNAADLNDLKLTLTCDEKHFTVKLLKK